MNKFSLIKVLAMSLLATVATSEAKVLNLMEETVTDNASAGGAVHAPNGVVYQGTQYRVGLINGAIFRRPEASDDLGSGGGQFRNLYNVQGGGNATTEQGYNRDGYMDGAVPNGFDPLVTKGDLTTDASGNFYVFSVDVNEEKNTNRYISLDRFEIYASTDGSNDPTNMPTSSSTAGDLTNLGDLVYNMDAGEDSTVLLDYSTSNGSGTFDLFVFVPVSTLAGHDTDDYVYLFTEFGGYTDASETFDFQVGAGAEEVAALTTLTGGDTPPDVGIPPSIVPEPHSAMLASMGVLMLAFRRRRG